MHKFNRPVAATLGAARAVGVGVLSLTGSASSAPHASAGKRACVGTWSIDAAPGRGIPPGPKLITLFADRNVILSEPSALESQNAAGLEFVGPGQGTYVMAKSGCEFATQVLVADHEGVPSGTANVSGTLVVASSGERVSGTFAIERVLETGQSVGTARTTFTGTPVGPR